MKCDNFVKLGKSRKGLKNDKILAFLPNRMLGKPIDDVLVSAGTLHHDWWWLPDTYVQNEGFEHCGGEVKISIGIEYGPHRDDEELEIGARCQRCKCTAFDFLPHYKSDFLLYNANYGIGQNLTGDYDGDGGLADWASAVIETLSEKQLLEILEKMKGGSKPK